MTRTQELLAMMRKLGFEKNAKELEALNESWKEHGIEEN